MLPTSGPLSLLDIKNEFGGNSSPALGDYYAGGSFVPANTTGTNGPVPSSGALSFSNFYGTSKFIPVTHTYSTSGASGTETVPTGASSLTITADGPGGSGEAVGFNFGGLPNGNVSPGGAGGGRAVKTIGVSSSDWGGGLSYFVGTGEYYEFNTDDPENPEWDEFPLQPTTVTGSLTAGSISISVSQTATGGGTNTSGAGGGPTGNISIPPNGYGGTAASGAAGGHPQGNPGNPPGGGGSGVEGNDVNENPPGFGAAGQIVFAWT